MRGNNNIFKNSLAQKEIHRKNVIPIFFCSFIYTYSTRLFAAWKNLARIPLWATWVTRIDLGFQFQKKRTKRMSRQGACHPKVSFGWYKTQQIQGWRGDNTIPLTYSPNFSSITHCTSLYVLEDDKAAPLFAIPMLISYMFYTHPLLLSLLRMLFLSGALPVMWCCWCSPHLNFTSDTNVINEDAIIRDRSNESYFWVVSLTSKFYRVCSKHTISRGLVFFSRQTYSAKSSEICCWNIKLITFFLSKCPAIRFIA